MACSKIQLTGLSKGCREGQGSIKKVWMIKADEVTAVEVADVTATTNPNMITGITMASTGATWYAYNFRKNTSDMQSTVTVDDALGLFTVETVLNMQFSNMDSYKRTQLEALCKEDVVAIVLDGNGHYWYLGETYPLVPTSATLNSGKATTDGNLGNISLSTNDTFFPHRIIDSVIGELTFAEPAGTL